MLKRLRQSKKLPKYLVAATLLVVPLYPKFPFINLPMTRVSIRLEDFLMAISAIYLFLYFLWDIKNFLKDRLVRAIIIFLFVGFVSFLSASFLTKTVIPSLAFLHWLRRIEYLVPLFVGAIAIDKSRANLDYFIKLILVVIFIVFVYGAGQKYFNWPVIITQNEEYAKGIALRHVPGAHLTSTFAGHYDLASYLVLILPIVVAAFYLIKERGPKIALGTTFFFGVWLLANSLSRISVVSYLVGVTGALLIIRRYRAIPVVILISFIMFGLSSNLLDRYSNIFVITKQKWQKIIHAVPAPLYAQEEDFEIKRREKTKTPEPQPVPLIFEDRSTSIRLNVEWPRAIRAFKKNPLLGTGYSSITLATDNDYLRALGEAGLLGLASFLLIFVRAVLVFLNKIPLEKSFKGINLAFMAGFIGAFPGVFLNAVFIDIFEASKFVTIFWLLMGFAVYLAQSKQNEKLI